jgi:uncharacterized protein
MDTITEQENIIKSGIYNSKQLFIATIIGGPEIAGVIVACNFWARGKKLLATIPVLAGLLLEFVLILSIDNNAHYIKSSALRHILVFALLFLLQTLLAFLIRFILMKSTKIATFIFPEIDKKIYHHRKIFPVIIISIVYFLTIGTFNFYLWIVLGFYLFTHIYAYILIYEVFGNRKIANAVLSSIVFLACFLPFVDSTGQILGAYTPKVFLSYTYLNLIVGYYVILVFYISLFILGLNILLLINRIIRIIPLKTLTNKTLASVTILIPIVLISVILVYGSYVNNKPVINRYSITIPQKSSALNSLKVISISDLHLKDITSTAFLKKLVRAIRISNPDIIVLPGDVAETYRIINKEKLDGFIEILRDIKPEYGIYAVKGNHDYHGRMEDRTDFFKQLGITMLADSLIESDNKFCLIGLNYRGNNEKRPIDSLLRLRTKDLPVLLLDHAPYCLEEAIRNKIDVQLSGHTHYGQIWPLNYITEAVYDIAWGYKKTDSTNIFVSCGAQDAYMPGRQCLSVPVRIGSVSEIMEINIEFR